MASQQDTQSLPPPVHECLKLLKSATGHQRLAGLDLLTQYRKANDLSSLHTIYHALPPHFLHPLLRSATALASFCRVPEIAAANDVVSKIPLLPKKEPPRRFQDNVGELDGKEEHVPADRCLMLVLEQLRVEVGVLLNALTYLRNEARKNLESSLIGETVCSKQRNVAVLFSLVEKIINLMSNVVASENKEEVLVDDEDTCVKMINGLNETNGVVLEYLRDAKEHGGRGMIFSLL
ncbi:hypothetical protein ACLB2K_055335 [Fragaria x ananassa]